MKSSLDLIRNKKKKLSKKFLDDQIFQKLQFSICALHGIKFLMDFNWIRCISETLRKISFIASGSYAKITYIVLIHMYQGRTGLLPLFEVKKWDSNMIRTYVAWATHKKRNNEVEKTITLLITLWQLNYQLCWTI